MQRTHKHFKVHEDIYVAYIPTLAVLPFIGVARGARGPDPPSF